MTETKLVNPCTICQAPAVYGCHITDDMAMVPCLGCSGVMDKYFDQAAVNDGKTSRVVWLKDNSPASYSQIVNTIRKEIGIPVANMERQYLDMSHGKAIKKCEKKGLDGQFVCGNCYKYDPCGRSVPGPYSKNNNAKCCFTWKCNTCYVEPTPDDE